MIMHQVLIRLFCVDLRPKGFAYFLYFVISLPPVRSCQTTRIGLATKMDE